MLSPMSLARGLDEETRFSPLNRAITKATGNIAPEANSKISVDVGSLTWVATIAIAAQIIAPASGIERDLL